MSALKGLHFVAVPKTAASDPKLARRLKFLAQLEQQHELAKDESYVVRRQRWRKQEDGSKQLVEHAKRVKRWWRTDASGNCYLILRYGNKVIAPSPDKGAIAVGSRDKLADIIEAVIAAARDGELDSAIDAAKTMPRGMKRKAA